MKSKPEIKRKKFTSDIDVDLDKKALEKAKKETGYSNRRYAIEKALRLWLGMAMLALCLTACDSMTASQSQPILLVHLNSPQVSTAHEVYSTGEVQKERLVVNGVVYTDTSLWLEGKSYALAHAIDSGYLVTMGAKSWNCTAFAAFTFYSQPGLAMTCREDISALKADYSSEMILEAKP